VSIWAILGIAPTEDRAVIRRAYAKALRVTNPEDDAEGFKALRSAYEMALSYADNAAAWDEPDGDSPEEPHEDPHEDAIRIVLTESELASLIAEPALRPIPAEPRFRSEPADDLAPGIDDPRAEREAEVARLNDLLGSLAQALHGPWDADEASLRDTLATILAQPAMNDIALYADVEEAIAAMLAATVPRSDAILLGAANAFGWVGARPGAVSYPVAAVLARLDEWRLIASFGRRGHPLRTAWRSLTRPPGPYWRWRLAALRPGMEAGVATLLGMAGPVAPGLSHAFQAASVARWERLLERPHWTRSMAAAIPLTMLLWIALSDGVGLAWPGDGAGAGWVMLAVVLVSPVMPFAARVARARWLRHAQPVWQAQGWMGGLAVVWLGAMLLPASPAALVALSVAAALAWLWMAVAAGPAARAERLARVRASFLPILLCGLFGIAAMSVLDPVHRAALVLVLALGATLMAAPLAPVAMLLARLPHWRAWYAVPVVVAIGGIAYGAARLVVPGDDAQILYAATLTLIAGSVVIAAAQIAGAHDARAYLALRLLRVALLGAFLFATIVAIGDAPTPDTTAAPTPAPVIAIPMT
jgi:hypothetical protein